MLGKQWLNRYASTDMRGSAIERSQNRQRKLDGVVTWYFDHVMESLPLMLQFALLLLGSALSRYLWEIDTIVASVVLGVASFGIASYTFITIAGAVSASCPYQTPGAQILRRIPPFALRALHSASSHSNSISLFTNIRDLGPREFNRSLGGFSRLFLFAVLFPLVLSVCLAVDVLLLARAMVRVSVVNALRICKARGWDPQTDALDVRCISWMLQTSLDKTVHLVTPRLLGTVTTLANFDPALVSVCFDILAGCVSSVGGKVAILQGSEDLAVASALCFLRALSHLTTVDPATSAPEAMRRRYTKSFPIEIDFEGFPSYYHFCIIHHMFYPSHKRIKHQPTYRPKIQWRDYKLSSAEHVVLVQFARFKYRGRQCQKVPGWILRFAHHLLSQDPLPSVAIIADWLSVIAMDLGCTVPNATALDERYVLSDGYPPF